jgi:hypothetical protein
VVVVVVVGGGERGDGLFICASIPVDQNPAFYAIRQFRRIPENVED